MVKKINKILIANRGEIACRIIQTCKENNIISVAIYSEIDEDALHVQLADEAYLIGDAPAQFSYLNYEKIISTALQYNCDAIHPGYGFLSENWQFNKAVSAAGLIFIGPNYESMRLLGSKTESRELMIANNIPVVPGWRKKDAEADEYLNQAKIIGFPILIKAAGGGGGKGMRTVHNETDFIENFEAAKRESMSAFKSDELFIEKFIEKSRHIEFQICGDKNGNFIHLFERECSLQRRHQKIIEETPSTALNQELCNLMADTAINACRVANYDNIGTVEFLLDNYNNFYFLEVNARIQVEHPITEETTGIDLVKLQIDIAEGNKIPFEQNEIKRNGHSIECRIYAEDGANNFMPSSGKVLFLKEPKGKGIRYDSGIFQGCRVSEYYDPIMAKLIVKGQNREEARKKMIYALQNNIILGVANSIEFLLNTLESDDFIEGNTFTNTISKNYNLLNQNDYDDLNYALALAAHIDKKAKLDKSNVKFNNLTSVSNYIGEWELNKTGKIK